MIYVIMSRKFSVTEWENADHDIHWTIQVRYGLGRSKSFLAWSLSVDDWRNPVLNRHWLSVFSELHVDSHFKWRIPGADKPEFSNELPTRTFYDAHWIIAAESTYQLSNRPTNSNKIRKKPTTAHCGENKSSYDVYWTDKQFISPRSGLLQFLELIIRLGIYINDKEICQKHWQG